MILHPTYGSGKVGGGLSNIVESSQMDVIGGGRSRKLTRTGYHARNQRRYEEIGPAWYGAPLDKDELGGENLEKTDGPTLLYTFYHYAPSHPVSRLPKYQNGLSGTVYLSPCLLIQTPIMASEYTH